MGLTNQERINFNSKVLAANVQDGVPSKQWYEGMRPNFFILEDGQILTQFDIVRANPASSLTQARTNAAGPLAGIIEDISQSASAIRLTEDIAANGFQYIALSTYNDFSSDRLDKWVQPQKVPQSNGQPSIGYSIQLYDGDPASGGTLVNTSDGQTGSGNTASVGWVFNYDTGTLILSEDFKSSVSDPYIVGFRYIGDTVATGLSEHYHERIYFQATQTTHGFSLGPQITPVYHSSSGWQLACADNNETLALAIVTNVPDENTLEITLDGRTTVTGHGLSLYQYYFLSQTTPGTVDSAYLTTGISQPLLWVEDANTIIIHRERATEEASNEWPDVTIEGNLISTTENLIIPIDYDDEDVQEVGDPSEEIVFVTQQNVNDYLTTQGWTAFKHLAAAYECLPTFVKHSVTFTLAAGVHRPRSTDTTNSFPMASKILIGNGKIIITGASVSSWDLVDGSLSNLAISSKQVGNQDPYVTISGTPFNGFDLKGWYAVFNTGQVTPIHDHTDDTLYVNAYINPVPTSVSVMKPSTILRNSLNDTTKTSSRAVLFTDTGNSELTNVIDNAFIYQNLLIQPLACIRSIEAKSGSHILTNVLSDKDYLVNENRNSFNFSNMFLLSMTSCVHKISSQTSDTPLYADNVYYVSLDTSYIKNGKDGVVFFNCPGQVRIGGSVFENTGLYSYVASLQFINSGSIEFSEYNQAKLTEVRSGGAGAAGIRFSNSYMRNTVGSRIIIKNVSGAGVRISERNFIDMTYDTLILNNPGGFVDGGGNTNYGIYLEGPYSSIKFGSGNNITGTLGDVLMSDNNSLSYTTISNDGPYIDSRFNIVEKE